MESLQAIIVLVTLGLASIPALPHENPDSNDEVNSRESKSSKTVCDQPEMCGPNSECNMMFGYASCDCLADFVGSPPNCARRCETDADCPGHLVCSSARQAPGNVPRCVSPCKVACGVNADCTATGRQANCSCPKNWFGDPHSICRECRNHSDCPDDRPACVFQLNCINHCDGLCGTHAHCRIEKNDATGDVFPICSCPEGRTGDPFDYCRLITKGDPCKPNPCGRNTDCMPSRNFAYPICSCKPGYYGDARTADGCESTTDCVDDSDCPDNQSCVDAMCLNPCFDLECGQNTVCLRQRHRAVCQCQPGFEGNPEVACSARA